MISDWKLKTLGDVCEFYNGKAHEKVIDDNGKYIVINSKFISSNGAIVKKTNSLLFPLYVGDIVMVMSDVPNGKALSKCFLVNKDNTYSLNQRICAIRSTNFDNKFLYYQLDRNRYFLEFDNGENQTNLRKNDILNCPLLVPPIPEQKRIVAILDKAFAAIDRAKANAEKNLQNSRELFESYLNKIFANPGEDWEEKKLGKLCDFVRGPFGGSLKKQIFVEDGFAVYEQSHAIYNQFERIRYFINDEKFREMSRFEVRPGNLIMSCSGTMGKISIVPEGVKQGIINQALLLLKPNSFLFNKFLKYWMESDTFQDSLKMYSKGAAIQNVASVKTLKEIKISVPSISTQKRIVKKLDEFLYQSKKLETLYKQKLTDLEELKKSILQKAFEGEL